MARTTQLYVDSSRRASRSTSATDFYYRSFNRPIRAYGLQITGWSIPHSWYVISSTNNTVAVLVGGTTYTVTLAVGNWSIADVLTDLQTKLNAAGTGLVWTCTVPSFGAAIVRIAATGAFQIVTTTTARRVLGFTTLPSAVAASVDANAVYDLSGTKYLLVSSNKLTGFCQNLAEVSTSGDGGSSITSYPILCSIDVTEPIGAYITPLRHLSLQATGAFPVEIYGDVDFRLLDDELQPVNLNGLSWSLTLSFIEE